MTAPVKIDLRGFAAVERYFTGLPKISAQAASFAVNDGAKWGARRGSEAIRAEVAFSRSYIGDASNANAKLRISKTARTGNLEAVLTARDRPTSMARFARGTPTFGKRTRGPRVKVKGGGASKVLRKGFFVRLRSGDSGELGNVGLAIRLKKGEKMRNKRQMITLSKGVVLLYGPSVAQVFRTVRDDMSDDVGNYTQTSFFRHFERLSK